MQAELSTFQNYISLTIFIQNLFGRSLAYVMVVFSFLAEIFNESYLLDIYIMSWIWSDFESLIPSRLNEDGDP